MTDLTLELTYVQVGVISVFHLPTLFKPIFMCFKQVMTESGELCATSFEFAGVQYKRCTINGPNNLQRLPQCLTAVSNTWQRCNGKRRRYLQGLFDIFLH